ncbi:MAG TPA: hypothetical protein VIF88_02100 [Methylocystis sp.]
MSNSFVPKAAAQVEHDELGREELLALLRDVTEQRDQLLSQYEAMAIQVDESTREISDAMVDARCNAEKLVECEHHSEQEVAHADQVSRELDKERRERIEIAAEFARFRDAMEHAPVEDPWGTLWRAVSQIVSDWVAWVRAKFPSDSSLLPWFDRVIVLAKAVGRLALKWGKAISKWIEPRVIAFWRWLKNEVARRIKK